MPKGYRPEGAGRKKQGDSVYYERCTPEKKQHLKKCSQDYDNKKKEIEENDN